MKKLLSLLLTLSLLIACAPFAAFAEELEPVVLQWYYPGEEKEGSQDVIEVFNEKLQTLLPNTKVEFTFVGNFDAYGAQWPLLLAGGDEMDIAWEGWNTPLLQDAIDGNVLPLTDIINEYAPNLQKEVGIWKEDYAAVTLDGQIYAIPSIQPNSIKESTQLVIAESIYEYFDAHQILEECHNNDKMTEKVLDLLEEGLENAIEAGALTVGDNTWLIGTWGVIGAATRGYVCLDQSSMGGMLGNYYIDPTKEEIEVLYYLEIPEVQMAVERIASWREKGWITDSQAADQMQDGAEVVVSGNQTLQGMWTDLIDEKGVKKYETDQYGRVSYALLQEKPGQAYVGVSSFGYATALAVPYTSKNPERAIMLLDLLRDEAGTPGNELLNLLCYGFEINSPEAAKYGWFNYEAVTEDGQLFVDTSVREGADSKHEMVNWVMGNTFKTIHDGHVLTTASNKAYARSYWTDIYPMMKKCVVSGMNVDPMPVSNELETIKVIQAEFEVRIRYTGGLDILNECLEKMNASGLLEIKSVLKDQIEEKAN